MQLIYVTEKGISLVSCLPLLPLRLFDHSDIIPTSVTQSQGGGRRCSVPQFIGIEFLMECLEGLS